MESRLTPAISIQIHNTEFVDKYRQELVQIVGQIKNISSQEIEVDDGFGPAVKCMFNSKIEKIKHWILIIYVFRISRVQHSYTRIIT